MNRIFDSDRSTPVKWILLANLCVDDTKKQTYRPKSTLKGQYLHGCGIQMIFAYYFDLNEHNWGVS